MRVFLILESKGKMNCPDCNGRGSSEYYTCSRCYGKGIVNKTRVRILLKLSEITGQIIPVTTASIMERVQ